MNAHVTDGSFSTRFTVSKTPADVFAAINDVRGWWGGEIVGESDRVGARFSYRYEDMHRSTQEVTELVPGEKVVWHVADATLTFVANRNEWAGTDIVFEIVPMGAETELRFTHRGLVPAIECFEDCSNGWGFYVGGSLKQFIETGKRIDVS